MARPFICVRILDNIMEATEIYLTKLVAESTHWDKGRVKMLNRITDRMSDYRSKCYKYIERLDHVLNYGS